jgi:hypothetical protein
VQETNVGVRSAHGLVEGREGRRKK